MTNEHVVQKPKINRHMTDSITNVYFHTQALTWNEQTFKQTHAESKTL